MAQEIFSPMAIDALGEMMNISLGSSATAVSNMLDQRVDITTPKVSVVKTEDFTLGNLEPAMGVEIKYVSGLEGSNIMLLKRSDIKVIVDILMGSEIPEEEFELNELTISAICELMNQMMGAASTALSDFLGFSVNISTPQPFELDDLTEFKQKHLPQGVDTLVVVRFALKIEGTLESEFMNVMSVDLARELLKGLGLSAEDISPDGAQAETPQPAAEPASGGTLSQEEIEKLLQTNAPAAAAPQPEPAAEPASGGKLSQEEIEKLLQANTPAQEAPAAQAAPAPSAAPQPAAQQPAAAAQKPQQPTAQPAAGSTQPAASAQAAPAYPQMPEGMAYAGGQMGYPPMYYPPYPYPMQTGARPDPKVINTQPLAMPQLDVAQELGQEQAQNLDLIMEVPLQVTVEIGRTRRKVQDILEFSKGTLVVLDKLAGDQVDLFVNGKCIARGDVVVIDDNFGVRITEIVQKSGLEKSVL